ncbi:PTS transporter subunit EIIC [Arsenicicoccus sp. oral taxon 190]|uniref:PTS transporter subunit EIIC n=1 Tax=Arsenicicoccus sp. oral taxon 190 TaxID=1658671 RepID=UPI000A51AC7E|nr:PTS transporter subunit EIIC [Arsenicicoccus sp. oral taxon 190]
MADPRTIATQAAAALGGPRNIADVENCITRLRVTVRDQDAVDQDRLRAIDGVLGVVMDDTVQVVLGPGLVNDVATAMEADRAEPNRAEAPGATTAYGTDAASLRDRGQQIRSDRKRRNQTPVKAFLRRIANIFLPLIPALIACGIIAGLNGVLINLVTRGAAPWAAPITPVLAAVASGFMTLIAVFVGMNAAKEFGGTPILGGAVAAIIPFAGVAKVTVAGEKLAPGQGGVIGALLAAILAAYLERWARRWAPASISMLLVPTFVVLVAGVLTIFPLMTVSGWVASGIGTLANGLLQHGGAFAGLVLAGLFLPLVMLGLHQALIPIHTTLIQQTGYTVLLPILAMAGAGQVGAAIALYLRLKHNAGIRQTIRSALPAGFLGVGEPLIYGVTLPLGRPFVTACIGGAVGGGFVGLFNQLGVSVGSTAIGPSGWALFPLTNGSRGIGAAIAVYAGGLLVGYLAGFLATYFFGLSKEDLERLNAEATTEPAPPTV